MDIYLNLTCVPIEVESDVNCSYVKYKFMLPNPKPLVIKWIVKLKVKLNLKLRKSNTKLILCLIWFQQKSTENVSNESMGANGHKPMNSEEM